MAETTLDPSSAALLANQNDGWGNGMGFMWIFALLILANGGGFGWGGGNAAAALGYENLATSAEVQRGFDAQNSMANEREILAAVNAVGANGVQAGYQNTQYLTGQFNDKYGELARDIAGVAAGVQQSIFNQQQCCCDTKMLISEVTGQNRYDSAMQTNAIIQTVKEEGAMTRAMYQQDRYADLQQKYSDLNLAYHLATVPRVPTMATYNAGPYPFCQPQFN